MNEQHTTVALNTARHIESICFTDELGPSDIAVRLSCCPSRMVGGLTMTENVNSCH